MIGTPNSSHRFSAAALFLAALGATSIPSRADELRLLGDSRLSGDVLAIRDDGSVELVSPLSPDPLRLKASAVRQVVFSDSFELPALPTARVELINGDLLPVQVESLDKDVLQVSSPIAGSLKIPRGAIKSLQMGVYPDRYIYSGPGDDRSEWINEGGTAWSIGANELQIEGPGRIARLLPPAEQFVVRFDFSWSANPNLQFYFADPLEGPNLAVDRYYLQFGAAGMEVKREAKGTKRWQPLHSLNRQPGHYVASRIHIEIRVDRRQQMLELLINGEFENRFWDPIAGAPTAGGIAFVSNAQPTTTQTIRNIEVLHWDAAGDRHRTEERGDATVDALISSQGDRMEGNLQEIVQSEDGPVFVFKSDFQDAPAQLGELDVSTIFFANGAEPAADPANAHPFSLKLHGNGVLQVASCSFAGDLIEAQHPLLGPLSLRRSGVTALERSAPKSPAVPKP
jgi:hypothetical protein